MDDNCVGYYSNFFSYQQAFHGQEIIQNPTLSGKYTDILFSLLIKLYLC